MASHQSSSVPPKVRNLRLPIVIAAVGLLFVVLADRIAASMLGIGFFTPFAYRSLQQAREHATAANVLQVGGGLTLLFAIPVIVSRLRARRQTRAPADP
jgi:hypothetical protein